MEASIWPINISMHHLMKYFVDRPSEKAKKQLPTQFSPISTHIGSLKYIFPTKETRLLKEMTEFWILI